MIGTGSPFPPVDAERQASYRVAQTNNAYVFPGMGLGVLAVKARRVSDGMFAAAAKALAAISPALRDPAASLLPPVSDLRAVAVTIAAAVAKQARAEGLCAPFEDAALPCADRRQDVGAGLQALSAEGAMIGAWAEYIDRGSRLRHSSFCHAARCFCLPHRPASLLANRPIPSA